MAAGTVGLLETARWFPKLIVECNGVKGQILGGHHNATTAINVKCCCSKKKQHQKDNPEDERKTAPEIYTIDGWLDHCIPGNDEVTANYSDDQIEQHCWDSVFVSGPASDECYRQYHEKSLFELCQLVADWAGGPALAGQKIWVYWCAQEYDDEVMAAVRRGTAARGSERNAGIWYLGEVLGYDDETASFIVYYPSDASFTRVLLPLTHVHWSEQQPAENRPTVVTRPTQCARLGPPANAWQYQDVAANQDNADSDQDASDVLVHNMHSLHDPSSSYLLDLHGQPSGHAPSPQLTLSGTLHDQLLGPTPLEVEQPADAPETAANEPQPSSMTTTQPGKSSQGPASAVAPLGEWGRPHQGREKEGSAKSNTSTARQPPPAVSDNSASKKAKQQKAAAAAGGKAGKAGGVVDGGVRKPSQKPAQKAAQKAALRDYGDFDDIHEDKKRAAAKPNAAGASTSKHAAGAGNDRTGVGSNAQPSAVHKGMKAHSPSPQPEQPVGVHKKPLPQPPLKQKSEAQQQQQQQLEALQRQKSAVRQQQQQQQAEPQRRVTVAAQPADYVSIGASISAAVPTVEPTLADMLAAVHKLTGCAVSSSMTAAANALSNMLFKTLDQSQGVEVHWGTLPDAFQLGPSSAQLPAQPALRFVPCEAQQSLPGIGDADQLVRMDALCTAFMKQSGREQQSFAKQVKVAVDHDDAITILNVYTCCCDGKPAPPCLPMACVHDNARSTGVGLQVTVGGPHPPAFKPAAQQAGSIGAANAGAQGPIKVTLPPKTATAAPAARAGSVSPNALAEGAAAGAARAGSLGPSEDAASSFHSHSIEGHLLWTQVAVASWELHVVTVDQHATALNPAGKETKQRPVYVSLVWKKPRAEEQGKKRAHEVSMEEQQQHRIRVCKAVAACVLQVSYMLSAQLLTLKPKDADRAAAQIIQCFHACSKFLLLVA